MFLVAIDGYVVAFDLYHVHDCLTCVRESPKLHPHIEIVSTNLGNVPTHAQLYLGGFVNPWIVPFPAITNPETWSYIYMHKVYLPTVRR